jgi:hypothetical protein
VQRNLMEKQEAHQALHCFRTYQKWGLQYVLPTPILFCFAESGLVQSGLLEKRRNHPTESELSHSTENGNFSFRDFSGVLVLHTG